MALEKKGNNRSNILKAGLVAAQMLSPFSHGKIEAAEIPTGASWERGIQDLRDDVFNAPFERSGLFTIRTEANQHGLRFWIGSIKGERGSVGPDQDAR